MAAQETDATKPARKKAASPKAVAKSSAKEAKSEEILAKAVTELLRKEAFFAHVLQQLRRRLDDSTPTLAVALVKGDVELRVNPEFFATLKAHERIGVLKHEVLHVIYKHFVRRERRNPELWNIACDLVINEHVAPWPLPEGALRFEDHPELRVGDDPTAEAVYEKLRQHARSDATADGGAGNHGGREVHTSGSVGGHSDHSAWGKDEGQDDGKDDQEGNQGSAAARVVDARIAEVLRRAAQKAGAATPLPASIRRLVEEALHPPPAKLDWRRVLRIFAASAGKTRIVRTRQRESDRYGTFPGIRVRRSRRIAVAVDTSGSIDDALLTRFFAEIKAIHRTGAEVVILGCDAAVHDVIPFRGARPAFSAGGGGTDFDPVFRWLNEQPVRFDACVYLTDGYANTPTTRPHCRLLWALSADASEAPLPFGPSVHIEGE